MKTNSPEEIETELNKKLDKILNQYGMYYSYGKGLGTYLTLEKARTKLKALLADQQREAKVEVLKSLAKEMDSCNDCPKDEPPSLHILKRLAELTKGSDDKD